MKAAAHTHSPYGRAFSTLGKTLAPITQDACAFYGDHAVFDDFTGVVLDVEEGKRIAHALGDNKAAHPAQPRAAHRRHARSTRRRGGSSRWSARARCSCWPTPPATRCAIDDECAALTHGQVGSAPAGWFSFQPLYDKIVADQPDLLD